MKLAIPQKITQTLGRNTLLLQKNSPTILFGVGVVGFVATTVIASRATLKLPAVLDEMETKVEQANENLLADELEFYDEFAHRNDLIQAYLEAGVDIFKLYGPAFFIGGVSIAALTGSHHILNKRNAGLTAAYAALDKGFTEYRNRVRSELGDAKDKEFRHGVADIEWTEYDEDGKPVKKKLRTVKPGTPSIYAKFFDELNVNWQPVAEYNAIFLKAQERYANDMLHSRGHLFLNEVYSNLGMDHTGAGSVVGWILDKDNDNYVDFGIFNQDRPESIDFVNGRESAILLDFNVDGVIYDLIDGYGRKK